MIRAGAVGLAVASVIGFLIGGPPLAAASAAAFVVGYTLPDWHR